MRSHMTSSGTVCERAENYSNRFKNAPNRQRKSQAELDLQMFNRALQRAIAADKRIRAHATEHMIRETDNRRDVVVFDKTKIGNRVFCEQVEILV